MRVEQQHGNGTAADGRIGQVEDGTEENEMFPAHKRHPRRPVKFKQREIEHVHHPPIQPVGITLSGRYKRSYVHRRTLTEDGTVEDTVDDITYRTRKNQRNTNDIARLEARLHQQPNVPQNKS